ncbi:MAG: DUF58 domain-containing protein [Oscillospiraceae bacterium]|nr:DUF58 domain-containing protein [Oscillospiraceae bacterium]
MTVGYLCAIGIAIVFMLYMDGQVGVMMLSFLLLMPVVSGIMTWLVKRSLTVELLLPDSAAKQKQISAVIRLKKNTPLPLPFLRMRLTADPHFEPLNRNAEPLPEKPIEGAGGFLRYHAAMKKWKKLRERQLTPETLPLCLSMGTARTSEYRIALNTRFCGSGTVTLSDMTISDFLAMIRFRFQAPEPAVLLITPEIPELKTNSTLFRSVSTAVAAADEETEATPNHSASAMPGYEHRDYIPGDSLKRINWKLSSKRRHLMVRQDEPIALARLSVVLDFRRSPFRLSAAERFSREEQLIETALGFLMLCAKYGYPCQLCYADEHAEWSSITIDDGEQLAVEAVTLLRGGFRPAEELSTLSVLPPAIQQESSAVLLYITDAATEETAAALEQHPSLLYLLVPEQAAGHTAVPQNASLWLVTPERSLLQAGGEL